MTDGGYTTYGGGGWMDQLQQFLSMLAQMNLMAGTAAGRVPAPKTQYTTDEALKAIWDHEKAIRDQYEAAWGDRDEEGWTWQEAMWDWMATRQPPADVSPEDMAPFSPIQYATSKGYLEPIEVVETLESKRDKIDAQLATRRADLEDRKQAFAEQMGVDRLQLDQLIANRGYGLQLDAQTLAELTELHNYELATSELALQRDMYLSDSELRERQQDWAEWMGRSDVDLQQEALDLQGEIERGNLAVSQQLADLQEFLGRSESERANKYYELDRYIQMGEAQRATERQNWEMYTQWPAELGFQREQFAEETRQAWAQLGLGGRELDIVRELGLLGHEAEMRGLGIQERLGGMDILSGLRGPEDWMAQSFAQRGLQPQVGAQPPWWGAAVGGEQLPAYGYMGQPGAPMGAEPYVPPIVPWQVAPQSWMSMQPSEQGMMQGYVESPTWMGGMGGYWPDFQQQMLASWPTGTARGVSFFG